MDSLNNTSHIMDPSYENDLLPNHNALHQNHTNLVYAFVLNIYLHIYIVVLLFPFLDQTNHQKDSSELSVQNYYFDPSLHGYFPGNLSYNNDT